MNKINKFGSFFVGFKFSAGEFANDSGRVFNYDNVVFHLLTLNVDGTCEVSFVKVKRSVVASIIGSSDNNTISSSLSDFLYHKIFCSYDSSKSVNYFEFIDSSITIS